MQVVSVVALLGRIVVSVCRLVKLAFGSEGLVLGLIGAVN